MKLLCDLLGRKHSANTSPKAIIREVARSKSKKMTPSERYRIRCALLADELQQMKDEAKSR